MAYREMVTIVRSAVRSRSLVAGMPSWAVLGAARALGVLVRDIVLTRHELLELSSGLLTSPAPPLGRISFSAWVLANAPGLGRRWPSELARNYRIAAPPRAVSGTIQSRTVVVARRRRSSAEPSGRVPREHIFIVVKRQRAGA